VAVALEDHIVGKVPFQVVQEAAAMVAAVHLEILGVIPLWKEIPVVHPLVAAVV
jgi:hypothetical protein